MLLGVSWPDVVREVVGHELPGNYIDRGFAWDRVRQGRDGVPRGGFVERAVRLAGNRCRTASNRASKRTGDAEARWHAFVPSRLGND